MLFHVEAHAVKKNVTSLCWKRGIICPEKSPPSLRP